MVDGKFKVKGTRQKFVDLHRIPHRNNLDKGYLHINYNRYDGLSSRERREVFLLEIYSYERWLLLQSLGHLWNATQDTLKQSNSPEHVKNCEKLLLEIEELKIKLNVSMKP